MRIETRITNKNYVFDSFISLKKFDITLESKPDICSFKFDSFKREILWKIVNILECSFHNILLLRETSLTAIFPYYPYVFMNREWMSNFENSFHAYILFIFSKESVNQILQTHLTYALFRYLHWCMIFRILLLFFRLLGIQTIRIMALYGIKS